jgi:hypothetical protein
LNVFDDILGFLSGGRNYEITGKTNAIARFTIRNELFNIGKKLFLLQDGEERYIVNKIVYIFFEISID